MIAGHTEFHRQATYVDFVELAQNEGDAVRPRMNISIQPLGEAIIEAATSRAISIPCNNTTALRYPFFFERVLAGASEPVDLLRPT